MNKKFIGFSLPSFRCRSLEAMKFVGLTGVLAFSLSQTAVAQRAEDQAHQALYEQGFSAKQARLLAQDRLREEALLNQSSQLRAERVEIFLNGYRYVVTDEEKKEVQLIRLKEKDPEISNHYDGEVNIPATIKVGEDTYTVTSIGRSVFLGKTIHSLTIPETIRRIERAAFAYCKGLKAIHIPDSVEELGDCAFALCNDARSLYIGKKVAKVGEDVFEDCYYLQKIEVGDGNPIYSVRDGILYNKDQSELLKCPSYRKDFTELTLPSTVKKIAKGALEYCFYISKITLNDGLEEIHKKAFHQNYALASLHIPASVKYIADGTVFCKTKKLSTLTVASGNQHYKAQENMLYSFDGSTLISHPAGLADSLMVKVADGVKNIGTSAFEYCRSVKSIQLPASVETVGVAAFSDCGIHEFYLPEKVKSLPFALFADCAELTYLYLGDAVTSISGVVFGGCKSLKLLQIRTVVPPVMEVDSDEDPYTIDDDVKKNARLEVPSAAVNAYKAAPEWKEFTNISDKLAAQDIAASSDWLSVRAGELVVAADEVLPIVVYDFSGQVLAKTRARAWSVRLPAGNYVVVLGTQAHRVHID